MMKEITAQQLKKMLEAREELALVDLRPSWEQQLCLIEGSINVPMTDLPDHMHILPEDKPIVMVCHHGARSRQAAAFLKGCGFQKVYCLSGGIDSWAKDVDKSMKRY
jgi:rhodanese-related sulfurtransferase